MKTVLLIFCLLCIICLGGFDVRAQTKPTRKPAPSRSAPASVVGTLNVESALVYKSGDVKSVARYEFLLMDANVFQLLVDSKPELPDSLKNARSKAPPSMFEKMSDAELYAMSTEAYVKSVLRNDEAEDEKFLALVRETIKAHTKSSFITDFSGKATVRVPLGKYWVFTMTSKRTDVAAFWNLPIEVQSGEQRLLLDQFNCCKVK